MKILHLLSQRPDSTGSGIYLQAMVRQAAARGHDNVMVAGVAAEGPGPEKIVDPKTCLLVKFGAGALRFPLPGMSDAMPYPSSRFRDLSPEELDRYEEAFRATLQRALSRFQPDIIHSHHLWLVTALARRLFPRIPLVTTCHGSDLRQFQTCAHLRKRVLAGCRNLDGVMALSDAQKAEIVRLYGISPGKIQVTGAGYDSRLFYPGDKPPPPPVQLIYAGKLSRAKGVPWLLRALKEVRMPPWHLHLIGGGSGAEHTQCLDLAGELGAQVEIHGPLPQEEMAWIMRRAHLLVLPSFFEGLPLVVLEGLASGCRIVATDLPGIGAIFGPTLSELVTRVPLPRLRHTDQPHGEDEALFQDQLRQALQQQIARARRQPQIDLTPLRNRMEAFTWTGVFNNVSQVYQRARSERG